jgi:hypothetical protein
MKLALKITPQRSTQYANMTARLAAPELLASPLSSSICAIEPVTLAGQPYLLVTLEGEHEGSGEQVTTPRMLAILARLGATSEAYEYFEQIGALTGPFLRPLDHPFEPFVPIEMAEARRYKGKTNELFTHVLLNVALFAGAYRRQVTERLRILDPLAGGGTTLFLALAAGYDAFGIEQNRQDVESTALFVRQYLKSEGIPYKELDERGRRAGRRYQFEIGKKSEKDEKKVKHLHGETRMLVLAHGNTFQAEQHLHGVPGGPHMHAIVADLPYGIQHYGEIAALLEQALPAWQRLLLPGGTLALSWNATRIERAALVQCIEQHTHLRPCQEPPYTQFEHTVDRVIKKRDIVVAVAE